MASTTREMMILLSELALLAQIHNIPVVAEGSGGGGCRMSCEV